MSKDHLDLDALADHLADQGQDAAHLSDCAGCAGRLDELAAAQASVTSALAGLAAPAIPTDVAARIDAALADRTDTPLHDQQNPHGSFGGPHTRSDSVDHARGEVSGAAAERVPGSAAEPVPLPVRPRQGFPRWLAAAAAVAVVVGGIGTAVTAQRDRTSVTASSADAGALAGPVRNETGNDYADRAALAAAVGDLLAGTASPAPATFSAETRAVPAPAPAAGVPDAAGAAGTPPETASKDAVGTTSGGQAAAAAPADPLAALRTEAGLADCLRAVLPPEDPGLRPLAFDYGSYRGTPALVLVLPGASRESLDVFVVGADCRADNDALLFYASVPAP